MLDVGIAREKVACTKVYLSSRKKREMEQNLNSGLDRRFSLAILPQQSYITCFLSCLGCLAMFCQEDRLLTNTVPETPPAVFL